MGQMQDFGIGITDGLAAANDQPLVMPGTVQLTPWLISAIPTQPGDAPLTDRYGASEALGPSTRIYPPARVGGLSFYYFGRWFHSAISPIAEPSIANTRRLYFNLATLAAGEELFMDHGLENSEGEDQLPDMISVYPRQVPAAGQNWALTRITDTQIGIKNYDGVNTLVFQINAWLVHSIQGNRAGANQFLSMELTTLPTGGGTVAIPHGLIGTPDLVTIAPWDDGGLVEYDGMVTMPTPQDETNIYLANADAAAADWPVKVWAQRTHSIQL